MPVVDAAWQEWLRTNAARGCTMDSMIEAMVQAGFAADAAAQAVRGAFGVVASGAAASPVAAGGIEAALPQTAPSAPGVQRTPYAYDDGPVARGNTIRAFDRDVQVLMRCERPQVIVFANVLSP